MKYIISLVFIWVSLCIASLAENPIDGKVYYVKINSQDTLFLIFPPNKNECHLGMEPQTKANDAIVESISPCNYTIKEDIMTLDCKGSFGFVLNFVIGQSGTMYYVAPDVLKLTKFVSVAGQ